MTRGDWLAMLIVGSLMYMSFTVGSCSGYEKEQTVCRHAIQRHFNQSASEARTIILLEEGR